MPTAVDSRPGTSTGSAHSEDLRARFASVPGPHPLDADSVDLALFAVGWELLVRDLRLGLTPADVEAVEAVLAAHGVNEAFVLRDNLVNYKKVLLGIYRNNVALVHDLRRLATFFREPPAAMAEKGESEPGEEAVPSATAAVRTESDQAAESGRGFIRPSRYRELSDALCSTAGAVGGLLDGRRFTKALCCVPRHPDAMRSAGSRSFGQPCAHLRCADLLAEELPDSMKGWRLLSEARQAIGGVHSELGSDLERCMAPSALAIAELPVQAASAYPALLEAVSSLALSADDTWFVRCVLIARGAAKALTVRAETQRLTGVMRALLAACVACEASLVDASGGEEPPSSVASARASTEAPPAPATKESAPAPATSCSSAAAPDAETVSASAPACRLGNPHIRRWLVVRKQLCTLGGLRGSLSSVLHWLEQICERNEEARVLFVGADADAARVGCVAFAPAGFDMGKLFERPRGLANLHAAEMVRRLATRGWPAWIKSGERIGSKRASLMCAHCGLSHASTWVRDGVCLGCEHAVRRDGRCPFGSLGGSRSRCGPEAWCRHQARCFLCDGCSCAECHFHQGDGADVAALVACERFALLFFDWDRTLCSTRGGSPLSGNHSIDDEMVGVCAQMAGRVHVITRNVHTEQIREFLAMKGLPDVPVHRVGRPRSKAEIIREITSEVAEENTGAAARVLFVDDTIAEHLDSEMRSLPCVTRFLFARGAT